MDPKSNFLSVSEKFLQSDASIIQLSDSFTELVKEFKSEFTLLNNENKAVDATAFIDCINQYLHCIIEYAEGGTAQTRSSTLQQLCNKICTAVEELKIKHVFIKNLSLVIFEFLLGQPSWIAKEILRMYNVPIQSTEKSLRSEVVQDKGPYYLGRLMDALPFGDFDFQIIIIETLFRICTKEILNNMAEVNLPKEQAEAFCKINTDEFDLTARKFLNVLNEQEKHVVSLLCNKVTFDDYQLQEPPELASFKGMWVDFNVKARTVSLFLNNESFNQDCKWEMITLFPENILKTETSYVFNEEHGKKEGIAKFILKRQCQLCYAVTQHELLNCRLLVLHSLDTEKFREIFNRVFPKIHKVKPKQAGILNYKRVYKPLDIVSVKSSTTNVSTTFNVTLDSSFVGKKRKSSVGRHSVDLADSTIKSISSRSRSASSKKSINSSIQNQSIPSEIIKNWEDDLSLSSFKLKKRNENDEISSSSNLSVLELVKTKRDSEKAVATKKFKISSLDHVKSKDASLFKYSNEFLSNLIEIDDDDAIGGYEDDYSRTKSKLTKKEADSTTLISGLYNSKLSLQDDELIASDVLHSVEDICKKETKKKSKILDNKNVKKQSKIKSTLMKFKQDKTISRVTSSSLSLSSLSADNSMDGKINIEKEKKLKLHKKLKNSKKKVIEEESKIVENTDKLHCLGVKLSPDLFYSPMEEPTKDENEDPNKVDVTKIVQGFKSESKKKHSKNVSSLWALPNLSLIEPVRDCNLDKFDELKLERPKEVIEKPICDNLPEPDLIKVSQPKYKDICTESDIFETAKTNLDSEEIPKSILTANNLTLFQDLSQENYYVQSGSEDNFQEDKLTEEYKTKIKVLSDIRIQSPIFKSQLSQKDRRQLQEIEISVGVPTSQSSNSRDLSADPKNAVKNSEKKIQDSLSGSKAPTGTDNIHKSNPTSSDVSPLEYQEVEALRLTRDETNYCKPSSEEVQYSETQRTDSCPEYEEKTTTNDQINSQKTSQDEHDISKKNQKVKEENMNHREKTKICEKTTVEEKKYCTLSSQEIEYSETQKTESNPEYEEKKSPDDQTNSQKTSQDVSHGISSKTQSIIEENKNQEEAKTSEIPSSNTHETNSEIIQASTNSGENDDIIRNTQQEYKKDEIIKDSKQKITLGEDIKKDNIEEVISDSSKSNYTESCNEVKVVKKKRKRKLLNLPPVHQKSSKVRKLKETKNNETTVIEYTQRTTHLSSIMEKTESNISIPEIQKSSVINEEDISLLDLKQSLEVGKLKEAEKDQTQIQTAKGEKKYLSSMVEENECNISLLEKKKSSENNEGENIIETGELQQSQKKEINNENKKPHVDNEFEIKTFKTSQNNTKGKIEIPQDKYEINKNLPNQENIYSVNEQAKNKIKTKKSTENTLEKKNLSKTTKTNESCISPPALIQSSEGERGKNEDEIALSELRQLLRNKITEENENLNLHDETVKQISQPSQESMCLGQQEQTKNEISKLKLKQNKQRVRNKHIPTIIASKKISKESIHTSENSKGKREHEMPLSELRKSLSNKIVEENENWLSKKTEENISQGSVKEKSPSIGEKCFSKINDRKKTKKLSNEFIQSPEILKDENEEEIPLAELRHKNSPKLIEQISQSLPNNELKSAELFTQEKKEIKDHDQENNVSLEVSKRFEDNRRNRDIENKINAFIQEKKYSQNCRVSYYENNENSQNEINKKNKNVFIHSMIKLDGKVEKPSRESSIANMGDGNTKLQHENTEYQNTKIEKDLEKHVRNLNIDEAKSQNDQNLRNEHVQMNKNQTNNEISNFEVPEDEVEKSMCLLFGMAPDEPVTTKTQSTFQKILGEKTKNVNVTENTTNSFISSNVGMLKRGRKLFDKENEEENFMNFTMAQDKIETTQIIRKPGISKSLVRESKKTQPKTCINKTFSGVKKGTTIKRYSKEHKPLEQHSRKHSKKLRTNKLDAFYDRVIEKLKTPTSSKTSYQAVPKVFRNENDHLSKYDLDFSLVKESYQKKTDKPILKRKVSLQEVAHKKAKSIEERNSLTGFQDRDVFIESPTGEEDEDMRELIRAIGTIIQKFAKGHLKTPPPSVQKLLLASAETLLQL